MPRLLIPLLTLKSASASGVAFARGLLPELARAWGGDVVLLGSSEHRELLGDLEGATWRQAPAVSSRPARLLATRRLVPALAAELTADAVYVPDGQLVPAAGLPPTVVALHHHLNFSRPQGQAWSQRAYWKLWYDRALRRSCTRAAALVAPSAAFAEEFAAHVSAAASRLHVIPHGVGAGFCPEGERAGGRPYVLVVGNPSPYKNVETAIAACDAAARDDEVELRVVGLTAPDLRRVARRAGLPTAPLQRVRPLGPVPLERLPPLYRGARALLFPSRVESFGLPVLEAMACGTPVVAADLPALRELGAGAAELAGPEDVPGLAAALRRILDDDASRARARAAGLARSRQLSWSRSAESTAKLIRSCLA